MDRDSDVALCKKSAFNDIFHRFNFTQQSKKKSKVAHCDF